MSHIQQFCWICPFTDCPLFFSTAKDRVDHLSEVHWDNEPYEENDQANIFPSIEAQHLRIPQKISLSDQGNYKVVTGAPEEGQVEICVCKEALAAISPVFKVMVMGSAGLQYRESIQHSATFPEDDPDAFLLIMIIAHKLHDYVPQFMKSSQFYELTVLAHKYDCLKSIMPWMHMWNELRRNGLVKLPSTLGWGSALDLAWIYGDLELFMKMAKHLVRHIVHGEDSHSMLIDGQTIICQITPPEAIDNILQERERKLDQTWTECNVYIDECSVSCGHCRKKQCGTMNSEQTTKAIRELQILPAQMAAHRLPSITAVHQRLGRLTEFNNAGAQCLRGRITLTDRLNCFSVNPVSMTHVELLRNAGIKLGLRTSPYFKGTSRSVAHYAGRGQVDDVLPGYFFDEDDDMTM
ncbi:hypothetical protein BT63DRAFT_160432 [Microthyrium microscopicum]|uniref:C2H2-type domain-containing protein n=1 Tax=Microthyrium microscopicum TaxID=703497 RepID=A0A6A6UQ50_9PEZI|nr:hypothetical protein BT63DRAFT_160432 [Microthyrium microscopicum]